MKPGSARTAVGGVHGDALVVAVNAPAVDGRATEAARRALAAALGVPRSTVSLRSGATSRNKVFTVDGGSLKEREVKLGDRAEDSVEIVEGLSDRQRVAVPVPGQEPRDGAPVDAVR